ncbi:hypothetical protein M406DRAFT_107430, partial [Cryphonectria parasitica EP155]
MGLRVTTWNVNGIRNPFGYAPWNQKRSFQAMFDILEADIVIMQEAKIQRKDLTDDMVLVTGWDVFFSLPRDKKGYSGVAIYTRNAKCCPIRAEEGITGVLCPPKSTTRFRDLPEDQQIGGYPREDQLLGIVDEATLDSEGRTVILEFPAFVLIGVYVPATRDDTRTDFRIGFLTALDARIRNLAAMGKQVILAGDLNIIRTDIDTAGCADQLRKEGMTLDDFLSTPSRRLFNQLLFEGQVVGQRDQGREQPVLWDMTRAFHPDRQGMFTCWETKKNARPGNFGSRIDYILCTAGMKDWFEDANIQEGLLGSDHCPVFAVMADRVRHGAENDSHIADLVNPVGMFKEGRRLREWTTRDLLPQSAKLLDEFDRRRTIKDMFAKRPAAPFKPIQQQPATEPGVEFSIDFGKSFYIQVPFTATAPVLSSTPSATPPPLTDFFFSSSSSSSSSPSPTTMSRTPSNATPLPRITRAPPPPPSKRAAPNMTSQSVKKPKTTVVTKDRGKAAPGPSQSSLRGFFKPKTPALDTIDEETLDGEASGEGKGEEEEGGSPARAKAPAAPSQAASSPVKKTSISTSQLDGIGRSPGPGGLPHDALADGKQEMAAAMATAPDEDKVFDPIESKESWSKLLGKKRPAPLCE